MTDIPRISLDDVGTRGEHIMHFRDNCQLAVESLEHRKSYLTESESTLLTNLTNALSFISDHLANDFIDIEQTITKER
jgi:hypothetical protein